MQGKKYIMGLFKSEDQVVSTLAALKETAYQFQRVHSPIPSHKIMAALDLKKSKVGWFTLAGGIFGDHSSPISDTTILSSLATGCDHVDHVRTQLPYALLVAVIGMLLGDLGTAYGLSKWLARTGGCVILFLVVRFFGQKVHQDPETA